MDSTKKRPVARVFKGLTQTGAHIVLGNRRWLRRLLIEFAHKHKPRHILEIGRGKPIKDSYPYSMKPLFPGANFRMTDIVPDYGHEVVDITAMTYQQEFDAILCISGLEHIAEPLEATQRMFDALRDGGVAVVATPFAYPMHDEPADYWRFTEHGLRLVMSPFPEVTIRYRGPRKLPTGICAFARR